MEAILPWVHRLDRCTQQLAFAELVGKQCAAAFFRPCPERGNALNHLQTLAISDVSRVQLAVEGSAERVVSSYYFVVCPYIYSTFIALRIRQVAVSIGHIRGF